MFGYFKRFFAGIVILKSLSSWAISPSIPTENTNTKPRVVLIELFTSEGCSSCPPADDLLRQINGTQTKAGQLIVGISEHVTYWNSLGWSDPFSSATYTDRQNAYGARFALESVYTPQMIINGETQVVGNDRTGLFRAIQSEERQPATVSVHILATAIERNSLTVNFSAIGETAVHEADIFAVIADDRDQSNVARGENSGRTLSHVAVARSISRIAQLPSKSQSVQIPLPRSFQASQGHHLILFAQTPGNRRILGADTRAF